MSKAHNFIIVGNNVGALVAAESLSTIHKIALINPTPSWGGHFGGVTMKEEPYDLGMNFFEFTSFNDKSDDILTYDPSLKNDCGRFFHIVEKYVKAFIDVREVSVPQICWKGLFFNDFMISNSFESLYDLPVELKQKIVAELQEILSKKNPLHASRKKQNEGLFINNNLKTVSISNHGETFHNEFIEPYCQRILNIRADQIPALFHRIAWAPLIYPETLLKFFERPPEKFPKTRFHYPMAGYFSVLVERLLEKVKRRKNVRIINDKITRIEENDNFDLTLNDGSRVNADKMIWSMDIAQYVNLKDEVKADLFEKTSIAMVFISLPTREVKRKASMMNLIDASHSVYRITNQTYNAGQIDGITKMVAEINYDYYLKNNPGKTEEDLSNHAIAVLKSLNLIEREDCIENVSVKILKNALSLPTLSNYNKFSNAFRRVKDANNGNLLLLAQSSGFVSTSLNDQIVQGLKIGALFNN